MVALLYLPIHLAVALGVGWLLIQRLDRAARLSPGERLALAPLLGLLVLYYAIQGVGVVRLDVWSMTLTMIVMGAVAIPGLRALPWAAIGQWFRAVAPVLRQDRWCAVLVTVFCAISSTSLLQGMAPPNDYDSLMYHITGPKIDVERGHIVMAWDRALSPLMFPALMGHQSRLALVLSDAGAAQMIHGALGILAGILTALVLRRLGYGRNTAVLGAVLFISTRVVVWEMGTVEVDVPLAAFMAGAVLVYSVFRCDPRLGLGMLFGILVGAMMLTKYHGLALALAFGPVMLYDLWLTRRLVPFVVGPLTAAVVFVPHALRAYLLTGNPIFPIFNHIFLPGYPDLFTAAYSAYGTRGGAAAVFTTPWFMSIEPMKYFDGMIFGLPIFLALGPLVLLEGRSAKRWLWLLSIALVYYLIWHKAFGQQVRFLLPIMPILSGVAAAGTTALWTITEKLRGARVAVIVLAAVLAIGQGMFVGIYSVLRLPPALGFRSDLAYHRNTPTLGGAHFETCSYIQSHLKPGERYFSLLSPLSFYCPQRSASVIYFEDEAKWWLTSPTPPAMPFDEFLRRFEQAGFRLVLLPRGWISRRNISAEEHTIATDPLELRLGPQLFEAVASLEPLAFDALSAVYDGSAVLAELKRKSARPADAR